MKSNRWVSLTILAIVLTLPLMAHAQFDDNCPIGTVTAVPVSFNCPSLAPFPPWNETTLIGGGTKTSGPFTVTASTVVNPGQSFQISVVFNPTAAGPYSADVQFSYQSGVPMLDVNVSATFAPATGWVHPKYIVTAVEYAPPGSASGVSYASDTITGSSTMTSNSFTSGVSTSVSLSGTAGDIFGFFSGKETTIASASYSQMSGSSKTVQVNQTINGSTSLAGFTDPKTGVNHNYDYIFVWLNPIAKFYDYTDSSGRVHVVSTGYGYDLADPRVFDDLDVLGIPVGCITGYLPKLPGIEGQNWAKTCGKIAQAYARTWAAKNVDGSGPGLTSADLTRIVHADPFYTTYTPKLASGSFTTTDGRFTECNGPGCLQTIDFEPNLSFTHSQEYVTTTMITHNYSHTETFSVEQQISSSVFWKTFTLSLSRKAEMMWVYQSSNTINNSNGQTASFSIVGPAPGYTGPLQFTAFQDNYFGTFMFFP